MWGRGTVLGGRYVLAERLGAGGMGEVWRADDRVLERGVAVKILLPALMADERFAARFRREAKVLAALNHPGIVRVHDYGESDEFGDAGGTGDGAEPRIAYIVMELVDGRPLDAVYADEGALPAQRVLGIAALALDALHAAHRRGIVHRDIKPSNLMLRADDQVTVTDFGIAHATDGTRLTASHAVLGTARYIAPEQAEGGTAVPASDLYSLGAVCYELLVGRPPFSGDKVLEIVLKHIREPAPALADEFPEPVRAFVARALSKAPGDRYADAAEMAAAARVAADAIDADAGAGVGAGPGGSADETRAEPGGVTLGSAVTVPTPALAPASDARIAAPAAAAAAPVPEIASPEAPNKSAAVPVPMPAPVPAPVPVQVPVSVPAAAAAAPTPTPAENAGPEAAGTGASWWKRHGISAALLALAVVVAIVATVLFIASGPGEAEARDPGASPSGDADAGKNVPPGDLVPGATDTATTPGSTSPSPGTTNSGVPSPGASGATPGGSAPPAGGAGSANGGPQQNPGTNNPTGAPNKGGSGGAPGGATTGRPPATQPPAQPSTPPGCGGARWGPITNVGDGLPLGLAASAPEAQGAVVMGGTTQFGWVYSVPNQWVNFSACNLDGRKLAMVANFPSNSEVELAPDFSFMTNWKVVPASSPGAHLIQDHGGSTCLTDNGRGNRVTMGTCTPGNKAQEWRIP